MNKLNLILGLILWAGLATAAPIEPTWESMAENYKVPEWFQDGKTLYLHILKWPVLSGVEGPGSGTIRVDGIESKATSASFLANGEKADFRQDGYTLNITLPAKPLNQYDTVVKVLF